MPREAAPFAEDDLNAPERIPRNCNAILTNIRLPAEPGQSRELILQMLALEQLHHSGGSSPLLRSSRFLVHKFTDVDARILGKSMASPVGCEEHIADVPHTDRLLARAARNCFEISISIPSHDRQGVVVTNFG